MSFKSVMKSVFGAVGKVLKEALNVAVANGLTDEVIGMAKDWVKVAAGQALDNAGKREFVVKLLMGRGVSEHIARLATEFAFGLVKKELGKL